MAFMFRAALLCLIALPLFSQTYSHRISGTFGAFVPAAGSDIASFDSAPVLAFDWGYRFNRYGQFDLGVDTAFASDAGRRRNVYLPRAGYSVVVPVWADRVEATIGAGAGYAFYKPTIPGNETWLVYLQAGADYALVPDGKYRAGLMLRWYRDPIGAPAQQWLSVGASVSYHFGR
ncbi:MAG TPA: hypothetical protein VES20_07515 [Bryobacteraceae bacterium]|nr:hypothetical protein [Bryobacteraceae bacterium]